MSTAFPRETSDGRFRRHVLDSGDDPEDSAYARALEFSRSHPSDQIVTTDEVLSEYLTFFSGMTRSVRRQAGDNAVALLRNPRVKVMPQSRESFLAGIFTGPGPTRATA